MSFSIHQHHPPQNHDEQIRQAHRRDLMTIRRPTKLDRLREGVPKPKEILPSNPLPLWKGIPLEQKIPAVPCPDGAFHLSRNPIGESIFLTKPEVDFDTVDPLIKETPTGYEPLHDPNLKYFFQKNPGIVKKLHALGKVNDSGEVTCSLSDFNKYRLYISRLHKSKINEDLAKQTRMEEADLDCTRKIKSWLSKESKDTKMQEAIFRRDELLAQREIRRELRSQRSAREPYCRVKEERAYAAAERAYKNNVSQFQFKARFEQLKLAEIQRMRKLMMQWHCDEQMRDSLRKALCDHRKATRQAELELFVDTKREYQENKMRYERAILLKYEAERACQIKKRERHYKHLEDERIQELAHHKINEKVKKDREMFLMKKYVAKWREYVLSRRYQDKKFHASLWSVREQLLGMAKELREESGTMSFTSFIKGLIKNKPGQEPVPEMSDETREVIDYILDLLMKKTLAELNKRAMICHIDMTSDAYKKKRHPCCKEPDMTAEDFEPPVYHRMIKPDVPFIRPHFDCFGFNPNTKFRREDFSHKEWAEKCRDMAGRLHCMYDEFHTYLNECVTVHKKKPATPRKKVPYNSPYGSDKEGASSDDDEMRQSKKHFNANAHKPTERSDRLPQSSTNKGPSTPSSSAQQSSGTKQPLSKTSPRPRSKSPSARPTSSKASPRNKPGKSDLSNPRSKSPAKLPWSRPTNKASPRNKPVRQDISNIRNKSPTKPQNSRPAVSPKVQKPGQSNLDKPKAKAVEQAKPTPTDPSEEGRLSFSKSQLAETSRTDGSEVTSLSKGEGSSSQTDLDTNSLKDAKPPVSTKSNLNKPSTAGRPKSANNLPNSKPTVPSQSASGRPKSSTIAATSKPEEPKPSGSARTSATQQANSARLSMSTQRPTSAKTSVSQPPAASRTSQSQKPGASSLSKKSDPSPNLSRHVTFGDIREPVTKPMSKTNRKSSIPGPLALKKSERFIENPMAKYLSQMDAGKSETSDRKSKSPSGTNALSTDNASKKNGLDKQEPTQSKSGANKQSPSTTSKQEGESTIPPKSSVDDATTSQGQKLDTSEPGSSLKPTPSEKAEGAEGGTSDKTSPSKVNASEKAGPGKEDSSENEKPSPSKANASKKPSPSKANTTGKPGQSKSQASGKPGSSKDNTAESSGTSEKSSPSKDNSSEASENSGSTEKSSPSIAKTTEKDGTSKANTTGKPSQSKSKASGKPGSSKDNTGESSGSSDKSSSPSKDNTSGPSENVGSSEKSTPSIAKTTETDGPSKANSSAKTGPSKADQGQQVKPSKTDVSQQATPSRNEMSNQTGGNGPPTAPPSQLPSEASSMIDRLVAAPSDFVSKIVEQQRLCLQLEYDLVKAQEQSRLDLAGGGANVSDDNLSRVASLVAKKCLCDQYRQATSQGIQSELDFLEFDELSQIFPELSEHGAPDGDKTSSSTDPKPPKSRELTDKGTSFLTQMASIGLGIQKASVKTVESSQSPFNSNSIQDLQPAPSAKPVQSNRSDKAYVTRNATNELRTDDTRSPGPKESSEMKVLFPIQSTGFSEREVAIPPEEFIRQHAIPVESDMSSMGLNVHANTAQQQMRTLAEQSVTPSLAAMDKEFGNELPPRSSPGTKSKALGGLGQSKVLPEDSVQTLWRNDQQAPFASQQLETATAKVTSTSVPPVSSARQATPSSAKPPTASSKAPSTSAPPLSASKLPNAEVPSKSVPPSSKLPVTPSAEKTPAASSKDPTNSTTPSAVKPPTGSSELPPNSETKSAVKPPTGSSEIPTTSETKSVGKPSTVSSKVPPTSATPSAAKPPTGSSELPPNSETKSAVKPPTGSSENPPNSETKSVIKPSTVSSKVPPTSATPSAAKPPTGSSEIPTTSETKSVVTPSTVSSKVPPTSATPSAAKPPTGSSELPPNSETKSVVKPPNASSEVTPTSATPASQPSSLPAAPSAAKPPNASSKSPSTSAPPTSTRTATPIAIRPPTASSAGPSTSAPQSSARSVTPSAMKASVLEELSNIRQQVETLKADLNRTRLGVHPPSPPPPPPPPPPGPSST